MNSDEKDPKNPDIPDTVQRPEPNHISGKPYAKKGHKDRSEYSDDKLGFAENDEEPKNPYSWYEKPKERNRPEAPETNVE